MSSGKYFSQGGEFLKYKSDISEKSEKEIFWEQKRAEIEKITDRLGKGIDEKIKEAVTAFSAHEFPTSQSCEGHVGDEEEGKSFPWVEIDAPEPENWQENEEKKKEWQMENLKQQKRVIDLLEEFYRARQTAFDARLHLRNIGAFGAFRVQSTGAEIMDILPEEEQKKKLELYWKEIDEFSAFLKEKYFSK
ncbi:MAG: hypothetical protein ACD_15C00124G0001 [uncultured bacterium]|nr:MAG: hypothetical protein ACD_15C00124G0001 [uncultured bacterium]